VAKARVCFLRLPPLSVDSATRRGLGTARLHSLLLHTAYIVDTRRIGASRAERDELSGTARRPADPASSSREPPPQPHTGAHTMQWERGRARREPSAPGVAAARQVRTTSRAGGAVGVSAAYAAYNGETGRVQLERDAVRGSVDLRQMSLYVAGSELVVGARPPHRHDAVAWHGATSMCVLYRGERGSSRRVNIFKSWSAQPGVRWECAGGMPVRQW
jgi:hypothetical protein